MFLPLKGNQDLRGSNGRQALVGFQETRRLCRLGYNCHPPGGGCSPPLEAIIPPPTPPHRQIKTNTKKRGEKKVDCLLLLDWAGSAFEDLYITHNKDVFVYTKFYLFAAGSDRLGGSAGKESSTETAFNGQATGLVLD